jgi:DNA-binding phage protein
MAKAQLKLNNDDRLDVFLQIIDLIHPLNDAQRKHLAEEANVHWYTLYNWTSYKVLNPNSDTMARVANALGYELCLRKVKGKPKLKLVGR